MQEHSKKIQQQREAEAAAAKFSQASLNTGNQQHDVEDDENERRNRSESLRKQRAAVGQVISIHIYRWVNRFMSYPSVHRQ